MGSQAARAGFPGGAFRKGRTLFPGNAAGFLVLIAGWVGVWLLLEFFVITSGTAPIRPAWLLFHFGYFWGTSYFEAAFLRYALAVVRGDGTPVSRCFPRGRTALRFLGLKAILVPATLAGTALLFLPGSWIAARYGFSAFILIDENRTLEDALRQSRQRTSGHTGRLMLLSLSILGLNVVGAALLGIGLLYTLPVSVLAAASAYLGLLEKGPSRGI